MSSSLLKFTQNKKRLLVIAQAQRRARHEAHIRQLENTVTELQNALNFTAEQVAAVCPPLGQIREKIARESVAGRSRAARGGRYVDCLEQAMANLEAVLAFRREQASAAMPLLPSAPLVMVQGVGYLKCRL